MDAQLCGNDVPLLQLGRDPQADMFARCVRFQRSLGHWDDRISDHPAHPFVDVRRALHHIDMARQECAEAWDMLEGGWKNHKRNPKPVDVPELVMELVDVATFLANAYGFMGGQSDAELVAVAASRSDERVKMTKLGMDEAWTIGERSWGRHGGKLRLLYGYGETSFGEDWVKECAARVNRLSYKIGEVAESIRTGMEQAPQTVADGSFPAASGFIYIETMPWLYAAVQAVPGVDQAVFYSHFVRKNEINFERQARSY